MNESIMEKVAAILREFAETAPEPITAAHSLADDLGLSSLDVFNIVVMFEEEFGIEIPDRRIAGFVTVGDIAEYLQNTVKQGTVDK